MSGREMEAASVHDGLEPLAKWRAQGADQLDPVRFHFMEALQQRATNYQGTARQLLDTRLAGLIAGYAADLRTHSARAGSRRPDARTPPTPAQPGRGPLGRLRDRLDPRSAAPLPPTAPAAGVDRAPGEVVRDIQMPLATLPKLQALDDFKRLWTQVHADSKLRQSLEEAPENAGPLNSGQLVFRTLTMMSEISPGYLQQFLLYADTLAWMQHLASAGEKSEPEATGRGGSAKKRSRKQKP